MADIVIRPAVEAQTIAEKLIPKHHAHLEKAKVLYLFTSQKMTKNGRVTLGRANKTGALPRYLSSGRSQTVDKGHDFILLFPEEQWRELNDKQRVAVVDHHLCRLGAKVTSTGRSAWKLMSPDVEEFSAVLNRHGLWTHDLVRFAEAAKTAKQIELPFGEAIVGAVEKKLAAEKKVKMNGKAAKNGKSKSSISKVTISSGDKSVEMTQEQMEAMAKGKVTH